MKPSLPMLGVGLAALVLGGGVMWATSPDLGDDAPEPVRRSVSSERGAPASAKAEPVPEGLEAVAGFGPSKLPEPEEEASGEPSWDDLLSGREKHKVLLQPSTPETRERPRQLPRHDFKREGEDGGPLPVAVVGVELLFERRAAAMKECVRWTAPAALPGEKTVVLAVTVSKDAAGKQGMVSGLSVYDDPDGRYANFAPCAMEAVRDSVWQLPPGDEPVELMWAVKR